MMNHRHMAGYAVGAALGLLASVLWFGASRPEVGLAFLIGILFVWIVETLREPVR